MDTLSQLAPNLVPDLEHHFITSAPQNYDGFGTQTVVVLPYKFKGKREPMRIVYIPDQALDNHWQSSRYESGLYNCLPLDVIDDWIPLWEKIEQPESIWSHLPTIDIIQFFSPFLKPGMSIKVDESVLIAYLEQYGIKADRTNEEGWRASKGDCHLWHTFRGFYVALLSEGRYLNHKYFGDASLSTTEEFQLALRFLNAIAIEQASKQSQ